MLKMFYFLSSPPSRRKGFSSCCFLRTGKEIRFRFGSSEDKAGKEAKCRPTGW